MFAPGNWVVRSESDTISLLCTAGAAHACYINDVHMACLLAGNREGDPHSGAAVQEPHHCGHRQPWAGTGFRLLFIFNKAVSCVVPHSVMASHVLPKRILMLDSNVRLEQVANPGNAARVTTALLEQVMASVTSTTHERKSKTDIVTKHGKFCLRHNAFGCAIKEQNNTIAWTLSFRVPALAMSIV